MIVPLDHTICDVSVERKSLCVEFADGRTLCAPLEWFPALSIARAELREDFVIAEDGMSIEWPGIGEKVSAEYLLARRGGVV